MDSDTLQTVTTQDQANGTVEVVGYLIGDVSTRRGASGRGPERERWGRNRVVKLRNGRYVLIVESLSVVYHSAGSHCRTSRGVQMGSPADREDLPDDAFPCLQCDPPPPGDLDDDEEIRFEFPWSEVFQLRTAVDLLSHLRGMKRADGSVSAPVRSLIEQLQANDDDFWEACNRVVKIG
jgi:hypothetical protein